MQFGPFGITSLTSWRWREAPNNTFLLSGDGLVWKASLGEHSDVFIPLAGNSRFVDRAWTAAELAQRAAQIPVQSEELRISLGHGTPAQVSTDGSWPLGHLALTPSGQLVLATQSHLFGQIPRNYLIELVSGNAVHDWDANTVFVWFDEWRLESSERVDSQYVLASFGAD